MHWSDLKVTILFQTKSYRSQFGPKISDCSSKLATDGVWIKTSHHGSPHFCVWFSHYVDKKIETFLLSCNLTSGLIWAALIHSFWCGLAKIFIYYWFNLAARAAMHSLVKDFIRKRREDEEKAEKLFIDSLLDCDFMDEDEVCLYLSFFRLSLLGLVRCGQSNETSSAVLAHGKYR